MLVRDDRYRLLTPFTFLSHKSDPITVRIILDTCRNKVNRYYYDSIISKFLRFGKMDVLKVIFEYSVIKEYMLKILYIADSVDLFELILNYHSSVKNDAISHNSYSIIRTYNLKPISFYTDLLNWFSEKLK